MHFLPDVWVTCEACGGSRYTPETLAVKFRGKTIADVLAMTVDAALELFASVPKIRRSCRPCTTSASATSRSARPRRRSPAARPSGSSSPPSWPGPTPGRTLYILDEPTTGLHFDDVRKLLDVVHRLADLGNTVVIIEHNLEVIKTADWVIDLGPEAGVDGGQVVAAGPPEPIAEAKGSLTGAILKGVLAAGPHAERPRFDPKAAAQQALAEVKTAALEELDGAVKPPWEIDGRRWHTRDRVGRNGQPGPLGRPHPRAHRRPDPRSWATSPRPTGRSAPASGSAARNGARPCSSRR